MTDRIHWHGHLLGREDGCVLRRELLFEVEGQLMVGRLKWTWY